MKALGTFLLMTGVATWILVSVQEDHPDRIATSIFWGVIIGLGATLIVLS